MEIKFDDIDAKKWREENNFIVPKEYARIQKNNYNLMMITCFFTGMALNEFIHLF